jgi:putative membrane protein
VSGFLSPDDHQFSERYLSTYPTPGQAPQLRKSALIGIRALDRQELRTVLVLDRSRPYDGSTVVHGKQACRHGPRFRLPENLMWRTGPHAPMIDQHRIIGTRYTRMPSQKKDDRSRNAKARKRTNLATERTTYANERTFMAQARTGFSLVVVGITMLEFFDQDRYRAIAIAMIPFGVAIAVYGLVRYIKRRKLIKEHSLDSYREGYED